MIPRYQRILFVVFLAASLLMALDLFHLRHSTQDRLAAEMADAPLVTASRMPVEPVHLLLASDVDSRLKPVDEPLALPASANARARLLLQALASDYASPLSQHKLPNGPSVEDVFLLPIDDPAVSLSASGTSAGKKDSPQVAVVNLDHAFAASHPRGLQSEMLTLRSMVATLHANLPQIVAVRFLVGGQQAETLAGHADLQHVYSATEEREIALDLPGQPTASPASASAKSKP